MIKTSDLFHTALVLIGYQNDYISPQGVLPNVILHNVVLHNVVLHNVIEESSSVLNLLEKPPHYRISRVSILR